MGTPQDAGIATRPPMGTRALIRRVASMSVGVPIVRARMEHAARKLSINLDSQHIYQHVFRAGDGNRTRIASLEGWNSNH